MSKNGFMVGVIFIIIILLIALQLAFLPGY